jgi:cold shock CspA family protein
MSTERLIGQFYAWNPKGFGFVYVTPIQRYFVHISEFKADHIPAIGEKVTFIAGQPRAAKGPDGPNRLPSAIDVRPVEESVGGGAQ